jgi:predicted ATPase
MSADRAPAAARRRLGSDAAASGADAALELGVLGPFQVLAAGTPLQLPRQPLALLAALVLRAGEVVASDTLIESLWQGSAPASASSVLRLYVSQLRSVLPPQRLFTERPGYRLRVEAGELDSGRFEALLEGGRRALAAGNPRLARSLYLRALGLWRGEEALSDLRSLPFARDEAWRLDELRLECWEARFDAGLRLGDRGEPVADLERLVAEHPVRERLRGLLMLALYRAERQSDALECFRAGRAVLVETLGLEPGPELRELERRILVHDPALAAPAARDPTGRRAPGPHTRTIGRERELGRLREQLLDARTRLVTLVGPGGIGKTRLAVELARALDEELADGSVFVDLAPLVDPAQVMQAIGRSLGLREDPDAGWPEVIGEHLRTRELLLVVDNFEHLVDGAGMIASLLDAAPLLTVLATSRRVLRLAAEHVFDVEPLSAGDARELLAARVAASGVNVDAGDGTIAEIAARLEGMPLAIELAAPWFRSRSSGDLLKLLDSRLDALDRGSRDGPDRHRAMRTAIDWSFALLGPEAQHLFGRAALFRASFDSAAMLEVGGPDAEAADLDELVEASIVKRSGDSFELLEVVRQYGRELPAAETGRCLHAAYFLRLAETAEPELAGADQGHWLELLEASHDDLRAALDWFDTHGEPAPALRLASALGRFWYIRGYLSEGLDRLERAVTAAPDADPLLTANALRTASALGVLRGDYPRARVLVEQALVLYRELADAPGIVRSLSNLGAILHAQGEHGSAAETLDECIAAAEKLGEPRLIALARNNRGDVALSLGELDVAAAQFEQSLALLRKANDVVNVARSLYNLGAVAMSQGSPARAAGLLVEALDLSGSVDDKEDVAWCVLALAGVAARTSRRREGAVVLGFGRSFLGRIGATLKPFEQRLHDETHAALAVALDTAELEELLATGAAMSDLEAIALARSIGA